MSELAKAHCEECRPGTPPLAEQEAAALAAEVPDWERDDFIMAARIDRLTGA